MKNYPMVKLGDVCDILNGFAFKSENYVKSGLRIILISNVQKGYLEDKDPKFYPIDSIKSFDDFILKSDDILMSLTGNVGRVAVIKDSFLPAVLNQRVACLRPNNNVLNSKYLFQILNSDFFEKNCIDNAKGIAQKNMSTEWLKLYSIPLPNLQIQYEISNNIGKITEIIEKRKEQLSKLDELAKSRFLEMFGDPITNSKNLEIKKLKHLGYIGRGVSKHRPRNAPELLGGNYPLIQTGDIANSETYILNFKSTYSEIGLKQSKMWKKGTLCITIAANIAKTGILNFDACFPDSVVGFIAGKKTNNVFIHHWFSFLQKILEENAPESAQKNINLKTLENLDVILPPIELQNTFANFMQELDKSKFRMKKCLKMMSFIRHL